MARREWIGLIILALLIGLGVGYYVLTPTLSTLAQYKYDVLVDTLVIVLTVSAVVIAVVGYLLYLLLSERLKEEARDAAREQSTKETVTSFIHIGFVFWLSFDNTGQTEKELIESSIGITERALLFFNQLSKDYTKSSDGDKMLCKINNNLAYYYGILQKPEHRELAHEYAGYIKARMSRYPEERTNWQDTYDFVYRQYP